MDKKIESILRYGTYSPYWEEFTLFLPWDRDSAEAKLYLAGTLKGFSHTQVLQILTEQSLQHGSNFQNQGFFIWTEFFDKEKLKSASGNEIVAKPTIIKVGNIPYDHYKRVALENRERFPEIFLENGQLDDEFLRTIHFNATRSMSMADIEVGDALNAFITGTLVGCIASGKDQVLRTNEEIRGSDQN